MTIIQQKVCKQCKKTKQLAEFYKYKGKHQSRCRECQRAYQRQYNKEHREEKRQRDALYRENNRDKRRKQRREYENTPRGKRLRDERTKRWKAANPEKVKEYSRRRYDRIKYNSEVDSYSEWKLLLEYFDNRCLKCGSKDGIVLDHVIPLAIGGLDHITNFQPLCTRCNLEKCANVEDYRDTRKLQQLLEYLSKT